jgi:hypothetical protein
MDAEGGVSPEDAFLADIYGFHKASLSIPESSVTKLRPKYPQNAHYLCSHYFDGGLWSIRT